MWGLSKLPDVRYYIKAGSSSADTKLNAFDRALMNAGCANYNLVRISSILPSEAKLVEKICYPEGSLLPTAYATLTASPNEKTGLRLSAAIAIGIPEDRSKPGVIMEYADYCDQTVARERVIDMVKTSMKDRAIHKYSIQTKSVSKIHEGFQYSCVIALVSIMM